MKRFRKIDSRFDLKCSDSPLARQIATTSGFFSFLCRRHQGFLSPSLLLLARVQPALPSPLPSGLSLFLSLACPRAHARGPIKTMPNQKQKVQTAAVVYCGAMNRRTALHPATPAVMQTTCLGPTIGTQKSSQIGSAVAISAHNHEVPSSNPESGANSFESVPNRFRISSLGGERLRL